MEEKLRLKIVSILVVWEGLYEEAVTDFSCTCRSFPRYRVNADYTIGWEQICIVTLDAPGHSR